MEDNAPIKQTKAFQHTKYVFHVVSLFAIKLAARFETSQFHSFLIRKP